MPRERKGNQPRTPASLPRSSSPSTAHWNQVPPLSPSASPGTSKARLSTQPSAPVTTSVAAETATGERASPSA